MSATCCGHEPHGTDQCQATVSDWGDSYTGIPCPCDGQAAVSAGADPEPHPIMAKYGLESMKGDPLVILERHLVNNHAATVGGWQLTAQRARERMEAAEARAQGGPSVIDVEALEAALWKLGLDVLNEYDPAKRARMIAAEYARLTAPGPRHDEPPESAIREEREALRDMTYHPREARPDREIT